MKERILRQATRLFTERGYLGISMREVAEACQVSKPALYYHYQDKDALFLAVLEQYLDETAHSLEQARAAGESAIAQLRGMVEALFAQPPEQRAIIGLAMHEIKNLPDAARTGFGEAYHRRFIAQFEQTLRLGVARGELRLLDAALHTRILLGMLYPFLNSPGQTAGPGAASAAGLALEVFLWGAAQPPELRETSAAVPAG